MAGSRGWVLAPHVLPVGSVRVVVFLSPQVLHLNPDRTSPPKTVILQQEMYVSTLSNLKSDTTAIFNVVVVIY